MLEEFSLQDRVAVVTGGARGLGMEMMDALAEAGASVVAVDLLASQARTTAQEIGARRGVRAEAWGLDVTDAGQVAHVFAEIEAVFGRIDVLVAAAGIAVGEAAELVSAASWRKVIDVNINGVFFCAQAAGRSMIAHRKGGRIVLVASMSGIIVNRTDLQTSYNTSKAGVIMMAKSLAAEWAPYGIRVNALAPGYMRAGQAAVGLAARPDMLGVWEGATPLGRIGEAAELRGAVVYLASDASTFVTGHALVVDGGYTVW